MRQKFLPAREPAPQVLKDIRRATRRHFSAEDKIRIVLEGLRAAARDLGPYGQVSRRLGHRQARRHRPHRRGGACRSARHHRPLSRMPHRLRSNDFRRIDSAGKSTGRQSLTIDVRLPGMLTAVVTHPPLCRLLPRSRLTRRHCGSAAESH